MNINKIYKILLIDFICLINFIYIYIYIYIYKWIN